MMLKRKGLALLAIMAAIMLFSAMTVLAGWEQDEYGWWYQYSDGSYPTSGVYTIGGEKYVFDDYGYIYTNQWVPFTDGTWAYCTGSGAMARNTYIDGYYLDADGYYTESAGSSSIPVGTWWSVGKNGDTQDYRVDAWVYDGYDGLTIDFGHYEYGGSPYDFYSKTNPNGDTLVVYESNGQLYGKSTKSGGGTYKIDYDGSTLTIHWVNTTWNRGGSTIRLVYTGDGAVG